MHREETLPLDRGGAAEAGRVLGSAFVDDPLMRYYFEGEEDRSRPVRKTMILATSLTLRYGTAFRIDCDGCLVGVALLLPPSVRDFPPLAVMGAVLRTPSLWRPRSLSRHFRAASAIEAHRPQIPCCTLLSMGVAPAHQRCGHGTSLLRQVLKWSAAEGCVCLETHNERNLAFYRGRGFHIMSEFVLDNGRGPRTWTMIRPS